MSMKQKTHFMVDQSKCIGCGKCINVCSGMVLSFGANGCPVATAVSLIGRKWKLMIMISGSVRYKLNIEM